MSRIIPYKYSFIGHVTSLNMFLPIYLSYKKENYPIFYSSLFLYITTNLFWYNFKEGFIKKMDIIAVCIFSFVTAIESMKYKYHYVYWTISMLNVCIFNYNKKTNYNHIIRSEYVNPYFYIKLICIHTMTLHVLQMHSLFLTMLFN